MRVGVIGCLGRMGSLIVERLQGDPLYTVGPSLSRSGQPSLSEVIAENDVLIDFSSASCTLEVVQALRANPKPIIIGTTGLELYPQISEVCTYLSEVVSVVLCANTSLGACMQNMLVRILSACLDDSYDIRIRETHHRKKKDAVSGTAQRLAHTIVQTKQESQGQQYHVQTCACHTSPSTHTVEVQASRMGNIFGEHEVSFIHSDEAITIRHVAYSRKVFVDGVMRILQGLQTRNWQPGFYDVELFFTLSNGGLYN